MATVKKVYQVLDCFAPFRTQMGFDNAGLLVGDENAEATRVLVSLDITLPVIREAAEQGAQLIVAHHPVIFDPVKSVLSGDPTGDKLITLIRNNISAICAHTNLDVAVGGVNDALAGTLELKDIEVFLPDGLDGQGRPYGLGRIGVLEEARALPEFAETVKRKLNANGIRYVDSGKPVRRVAVGGGACGSCLRDAWSKGCDVLVTSDVKYDVFLDAQALGISLIDAGHFPTENVVLPVLCRVIREAFPNLDIQVSRTHREVFSCL